MTATLAPLELGTDITGAVAVSAAGVGGGGRLAVGGCAGCAVPVSENGKTVMRRVCVDGPVFDSAEVFFA